MREVCLAHKLVVFISYLISDIWVGSAYRDANPIPTSPLSDAIVTATSTSVRPSVMPRSQDHVVR